MTAIALLDTCSTDNYVLKKYVTQLRLQRQDASKMLTTVTGRTIANSLKYTSMIVSNADRSYEVVVDSLVLDTMCDGGVPAITDLNAKAVTSVPVEALLGVPHVFEMIRSFHYDPATRLARLNTVFGDTMAGETQKQSSLTHLSALVVSNYELDKHLQSFWDLEHIGMAKRDNDECKFMDEYFMSTLINLMYFADGHYYVPLIFKPDITPVKNNLRVAMGCFKKCSSSNLHTVFL